MATTVSRQATLTGNQPVETRSVAGIAGKHIRKTVLELGGSDPFIVMPSVDLLKEAVTTAVKARTINNGQSCIAAKRFIVAAEIYDEFERRFVEKMKELRVGDPLRESTDIGPLATEQILKDVDEQVKTSVAAGAQILTGGKKLDGQETSTSRLCSQIFRQTHLLTAKNFSVRSITVPC